MRIAIRATDGNGAPAPKVTVHFSIASGGGSVSPDSVRTDSTGTANTVWTLGPTAGSNSLTVSANGVPSVTATATAVAAPLYGVIFGRIATGQRSSCALASSNRLDQGAIAYCWGDNTHGELGIGNLQQVSSYDPAAVVGGSAYTTIVSAVVNDRACAISASGPVVCWGSPVLQSGGADSIPTVVPGTQGKTWLALSAGASFFCALDDAHEVWCWGEDRNGQLGDSMGIPSDTARLVVGGHAFKSITSDINSSCALDTDGRSWCWGLNELGVFDADSSLVPVAVNTSVRFAQLSIADGTACGIDATGAAYCWGFNSSGQVGNGTTDPQPIPTPVSGGLTFRVVTVGWHFACGIAAAGQAYCWGGNTVGELGDSTSSVTQSLQPALVSGGHLFNELVAGPGQACGRTGDGTLSGVLYCWGENDWGQAGLGSSVNQSFVPTQVALP